MPCAFCGEGDRWIKTCRTKDVLIRVCDPCYEVLSQWLVVVSGTRWLPAVVMSVGRTSIRGRWRR
jgi:hypothetical protein